MITRQDTTKVTERMARAIASVEGKLLAAETMLDLGLNLKAEQALDYLDAKYRNGRYSLIANSYLDELYVGLRARLGQEVPPMR